MIIMGCSGRGQNQYGWCFGKIVYLILFILALNITKLKFYYL